MNDEEKDKAYKALANAIVLQAVQDYREAILYNDSKLERDCERFFMSNWCGFLAHISGYNLAEKIKNETLRFKKKAFAEFDEKEKHHDKKPTEKAFKCPTCRAWVDVTFGFISKRAHSKGYFAKCRSCGIEYKRKIGGEKITFSKN